MANPSGVPQMNISLDKNVPPWEQEVYTSEEAHKMYRDWSIFFSQSHQFDIAAQYYDKALELKDKDPNTLYLRSICMHNIAQAEDALINALEANALMPNIPRIKKAIGAALYRLNQFEDALVEFHGDRQMFGGSVVSSFINKIKTINLHLMGSLGDSLESFFFKHVKHNKDISEILKNENIIDTRPLWKRLRDEGKCDILSILEKEEIELSPLEVARRRRSHRIFHQTYFKRAWNDVIFLHELKKNQGFLFKQSIETTPVLKNLLDTKYKMVQKFSKMLQARRPLYSKNNYKHTNKKVLEQNISYLNCLQYQTRRDMLNCLRQIKQLRKKGMIEKLAKYIEHVMGDYVVLKTYRIMPWKFEFLNEVYNTLALAFADHYRINESKVNTTKPIGKNSLLQLLKVPINTESKDIHFEFGNKSTSMAANADDEKNETFKKFIARLDKRVFFSKYPIEKAYLRHEIARAHFKQGLVDECIHFSKKAIDEAGKCNSNIWAFLSQMLIVKSHASFHNIERCGEDLNEAYNMAAKLQSEELCFFVEKARQTNNEYISLKRRLREIGSESSRRSSRYLNQSIPSAYDNDDYISIKQSSVVSFSYSNHIID